MPYSKKNKPIPAFTLDLKTGREYQFRYFFDLMHWGNDPEADRYIKSFYGNCDNSAVNI